MGYLAMPLKAQARQMKWPSFRVGSEVAGGADDEGAGHTSIHQRLAGIGRAVFAFLFLMLSSMFESVSANFLSETLRDGPVAPSFWSGFS